MFELWSCGVGETGLHWWLDQELSISCMTPESIWLGCELYNFPSPLSTMSNFAPTDSENCVSLQEEEWEVLEVRSPTLSCYESFSNAYITVDISWLFVRTWQVPRWQSSHAGDTHWTWWRSSFTSYLTWSGCRRDVCSASLSFAFCASTNLVELDYTRELPHLCTAHHPFYLLWALLVPTKFCIQSLQQVISYVARGKQRSRRRSMRIIWLDRIYPECRIPCRPRIRQGRNPPVRLQFYRLILPTHKFQGSHIQHLAYSALY